MKKKTSDKFKRSLRRGAKVTAFWACIAFTLWTTSLSADKDLRAFSIWGLGIALQGYSPNPTIVSQQGATTWLGVPDPDWGVIGNPMTVATPDQPTEWASDIEVANYYFVDFDTGTDSGRTYGTPTSPRATVPGSVLSGSTTAYRVELAGSCTDHLTWSVKATEANPLWVISNGANPFVFGPSGSSSRYFRVENGQYIFFDGIELDGNSLQTGGPVGIATYTNTVADMTHHICFRNCNMHDYIYGTGHSSGFGITAGQSSGYSDAITRDVVLYNNTITTLGDWQNYTSDTDFHGVGVSNYGRTGNQVVHDIWVCGNDISYVSGDMVQVNGWSKGLGSEEHPGGRDDVYHVYVAGNHAHHNRQSGGAFKQCVDCVFSQNHIHDMPKPSGTVGTGVMWLYGPDRVWIVFNHIHDCITGMRQSTTNTIAGWEATVYIIGNVIHDCFPDYVNGSTAEFSGSNRFKTGQGIVFIHANEMRHVYNNTIYNCKGGISVQCDSSTGCDVRGNIIMNIDEDNVTSSNYDDAHISLLGSPDSARDYVGYNVVDDDELGGGQFYYGSGLYTGLAAFESVAGAAASNNVESDPLMTDPANDDFSIASGSPARGIVTDLTAISSAYQTEFGVSVLYDYAENTRTFNGDDAGALEYIA